MEIYFLSDDKSKLDLKLVHREISNSYWANGMSFEEVKISIGNSFCFRIYINNDKQISFARVLSDLTTSAYLLYVFIIKDYRGKGYSELLLKNILNDERFCQVKRWLLTTKDAHSLYEKFSFRKIANTEKLMEKIVD